LIDYKTRKDKEIFKIPELFKVHDLKTREDKRLESQKNKIDNG